MKASFGWRLTPTLGCRWSCEYLSFKPWREIAAAMDYCPAYIYRLHNQALLMVATVLATKEVRCDDCPQR